MHSENVFHSANRSCSTGLKVKCSFLKDARHFCSTQSEEMISASVSRKPRFRMCLPSPSFCIYATGLRYWQEFCCSGFKTADFHHHWWNTFRCCLFFVPELCLGQKMSFFRMYFGICVLSNTVCGVYTVVYQLHAVHTLWTCCPKRLSCAWDEGDLPDVLTLFYGFTFFSDL